LQVKFIVLIFAVTKLKNDMGYSTDFNGSLQLSRTATLQEQKYLTALAGTRRMKRDVNKLMKLYKGKGGLPFIFKANDEQNELIKQLEATGVKVEVKPIKDNRTPEEIYGFMGEYFVGADGFRGQDSDNSVLDYNSPSGDISWDDYKGDWELREKLQAELNKDKRRQPSLWLQWVLNDEGTELAWDGNEKFYNYIEWLEYLIQHFFEPWGIKLNGGITWVGEDTSDTGMIKVTDNVVEVFEGEIKYVKRK
jgi:hypothetical protein